MLHSHNYFGFRLEHMRNVVLHRTLTATEDPEILNGMGCMDQTRESITF